MNSQFAAVRSKGSKVHGVFVDKGALEAVQSGANLLPVGIVGTLGFFDSGSLIALIDERGTRVAEGITIYSSYEIQRIKGQHSSAIFGILGTYRGDSVIRQKTMRFWR